MMGTLMEAGSIALQDNMEARSVTSKDMSINSHPLSAKLLVNSKAVDTKPAVLTRRITHSEITPQYKSGDSPDKPEKKSDTTVALPKPKQEEDKKSITIAQKSQAYNKVNNVYSPDFKIDRFKAFIFSQDIRKKSDFLKFLQEIKTDVDLVKMIITRQQCPNKVFLVQLQRNKKILFLDLDETLVHTNFKEGELKDLKLSEIKQRPYLDYFLKETSKWYNLVIFTAGFREYAEKVLNLFDPASRYIQNVLARENCIEYSKHFIKDFQIVANSHVRREDIVMLDNRVISFGYNMTQGIPILPFYDSQEDTELRDVVPFLKYLSAPDVDISQELKLRYNYSTVSLLSFTKTS